MGKNDFRNISSEKLQKLTSKLFIIDDEKDDMHLLNKVIFYFGKKGKLVPTFFLYITNECNLNCPYCFQRDYRTKIFTISESYINSMIEAINLLGERENGKIKNHVVVFGGEPLLPKNKSILRYLFNKLKLINVADIEIVTNGINLKQYEDVLKQYESLIGTIRFTLNGPKDIHNSIRNSGFDTFSIITDNINYVLDKYNNIQVIVNILLDNFNSNSISDLFDELEDKGIMGKRNFNIEFGRIQFRRYPETSFYNELSYKDYYPLLLRTKLNDRRITDEMLTGSEVRILGDIYRQLVKKAVAIPNFKGCKAVYPGFFAFYPDGKIYPCDEIAGDQAFAIGQYYPTFSFYKEKERWNNYTVTGIKKCLNCKFIGMCNGGCLVSNLAVNGDINSPYCLDIENSLNNFLCELEREGLLDG